jgi:hypothetical protein
MGNRLDRLLAIDPAYGASKGASLTAYALFDDRRLIAWKAIRPNHPRVCTSILQTLAPTLLVIEAQGNVGGPNREVLRRLVEAMCWWTVPAWLAEIPVLEIQPQAWQRAVQRGWRFGRGSTKRRDVIEQYVRRRWPMTKRHPLSADELCAIALGTAAMDRLSQETNL